MGKTTHYLSETHPHIAQQWHPTKNGELTPSMIAAKSNKKVWWKCPKGEDHEWEAKVCTRTCSSNSQCLICANLKVVLSNCLAITYPEIAKLILLQFNRHSKQSKLNSNGGMLCQQNLIKNLNKMRYV